MKYTYFIHYNYRSSESVSVGRGNTECISGKKISGIEDIRELENQLKEIHDWRWVGVTNFILLKKEKDATAQTNEDNPHV